MRRLLWLLLLCALPAWGQGGNAVIIRFPGAPSGSCSPIALGINNATGDFYDCLSAAWHQVGAGGAGTVTSVSGTANQIDVATGTTTPVISLDPAIVLPGSLTGNSTALFNTTTAATQFLSLKNTTAASSGTSQGSPELDLCGRAWTGSDVESCANFSMLPGNGANAVQTANFSHSGSSTGVFTWTFSSNVRIPHNRYYSIRNNANNADLSVLLMPSGSDVVNFCVNCSGIQFGSAQQTIMNSAGLWTKYNNISTVSNGVPSEYTTVDLTAQSAAIGATTLYATTATGMYRVCWSAAITTAGTTSTLGGTNGFQIVYTSPTDSVVKTTVLSTTDLSTANTTGTAVGGCKTVYAKTGTNVQYQFDYTSSGTTMVYELHAKLEQL